jgi:hypothetical protein
MRTKLTVATALAGALLATGFISASAQATSLPILKGDSTPGMGTLVGHGGHGGHGGGHGGHGGHFAYGGHGGHGGINVYGRSFSHRGHGGQHYAYRSGHGHAGKHYNYGHYAGHYRHYRYYGYYPSYSYGYYGGGCGWLYRNAVATGSPYWWNRYYQCTGYY